MICQVVCTICGNAEGNREHVAREMMLGLRDEFTYAECARCGCLQLENPPADLARYYPPGYYSFADSPLAVFDHPIKNLAKRFRYTYAVTNRGLVGRLMYAKHGDTIARTLLRTGITKRSRILDVGSGSGKLLYALRNAGFRHVMGIDPYLDQPLTYANGLRILKQSIHETQGEWDLVMLHHVYEHVPDPRETFIAAARLLAPGGMCLVRVPVASSYAWRHYGTNWVQLDAPRHLFVYTPTGIRLLAEQAGLHVEDVIYDSGALQFWGSEQYLHDVPLHSERSFSQNRENSLFSPEQIEEYEAKARELNAAGDGDQAAFYLRK